MVVLARRLDRRFLQVITKHKLLFGQSFAMHMTLKRRMDDSRATAARVLQSMYSTATSD